MNLRLFTHWTAGMVLASSYVIMLANYYQPMHQVICPQGCRGGTFITEGGCGHFDTPTKILANTMPSIHRTQISFYRLMLIMKQVSAPISSQFVDSI